MALQKPVQQRFNELEETLLPPVANQQVATDYTKHLTFNHAWDGINLLWRMLKGDSRGNLLVKLAAQNGVIPKEYTLAPVVFPGIIFPGNKDRVGLWIINENAGSAAGTSIGVRYNPTFPSTSFIIPVGWAFYEDNWNGDITITQVSGGVTSQIRVIEYF